MQSRVTGRNGCPQGMEHSSKLISHRSKQLPLRVSRELRKGHGSRGGQPGVRAGGVGLARVPHKSLRSCPRGGRG